MGQPLVIGRVSPGDQLQVTGISGKKCSDNSSSSMRLRPEFRHRSPRLRRCAKLCRAAGGALERVELLLGACVFETTERYLESRKCAAARLCYLGGEQDLVHAPNDRIKLRVAVQEH
jgi:hypothetical protein